jgi:tripartite-type tricarboxylate transporter receptor subunit TctC
MTHNVQFVTTPLLLDRPPYEPIMEFAPVIGLVRVDDVLLASQRSSATSVEQLIALGRTQPGRLNYGSFGPGSATHLDAESFSAAAGIKATHIPYKGGPDVLKALVTGEIDFAFTGLTAALPLIKDGRVTAIAYSGRRRAAVLPEVPMLAERGLKVAAGGWFGWFVPAGTPNAVIERIAADAADVLAQPDFRARHVIGVGLEPLSLPPTELAALLKSDVATYVPLVQGLSRVTQ